MRSTLSTPSFSEFNPTVIPFQYEVINDIRCNYDYEIGTHEVLLSGSVGSSKTTLIAHIALTHCLFNTGARFMLGRLSMPSLRSTLFNKTIKHIGLDLTEGIDYWVNNTTGNIKFRNGSEIICRSWSDKKYFKVRSLELSGVGIDEIIENETQDFYNEIKMRVGRLPHVKENIIVNATNPGDPSSWQYKYFIEPNEGKKHQTIHTYYSLTEKNPFLPKQYIEQLKRDLDPKMARRMLYGEWISIADDVIYYAYDKEINKRSTVYTVNPSLPVWISWDFNIGDGKPLSAVFIQFDVHGVAHCFDEVVIHGMRTLDSLDEMEQKGLLDPKIKYYLTGDAAGKSRDTRSRKSDYEIINHFFANTGKLFEMRTFPWNPPIRSRHNLVNAYCLSENGQRRLFVYDKCKTLDEGLRLTALKKGASFLEDDSKFYQHITTALGYCLHAWRLFERNPQTTKHL